MNKDIDTKSLTAEEAAWACLGAAFSEPFELHSQDRDLWLAEHAEALEIIQSQRQAAAIEAVEGEWQPVMGWEAFYQVNRFGVIRKVSGEIIGQWQNTDGYFLARLASPRKVVRVHRVVAEAFIPNPEGKPNVNHIDNSPANNAVSNLEWCTQAENLSHATQQGRMPRDYWKGKRSPNSGLTDGQVREIRELREAGFSQQYIAGHVGTSKRTVQRVLKGEYYAGV